VTCWSLNFSVKDKFKAVVAKNLMKKNSADVWAVVVTFMPDFNALRQLLDSLMPQVSGVIVVDNGSSASVLAWLEAYHSALPLVVIPLHDNMGIAAAQNRGIEYARSQLADYIILFDHDSDPASDMVAKLLAVAQEKAADGVDVAAVGPRYLDKRQENPPPFIEVRGLLVKRKSCTCDDSVVDVSYLIASGSLIPLRTLNAVGVMREELFIDYVDIEWGMRARSMGFHSFGVCAALMSHDLGDEPFLFFGRKYPSHSASRHYYHFRNAVWMYRQSWLPLNWKFADGWRLMLKYGFYCLFAKPRHVHCWMMTRGIWDALRGRMGKLN
jgi:rhamnosyltransferase